MVFQFWAYHFFTVTEDDVHTLTAGAPTHACEFDPSPRWTPQQCRDPNISVVTSIINPTACNPKIMTKF